MSPKPFVGSVRPLERTHGGIISQGAKCGQSWSTVEIWIPKNSNSPTSTYVNSWFNRNKKFMLQLTFMEGSHRSLQTLWVFGTLKAFPSRCGFYSLVASWLVVAMRTPKCVSSGTLVYPLIWSYLSNKRLAVEILFESTSRLKIHFIQWTHFDPANPLHQETGRHGWEPSHYSLKPSWMIGVWLKNHPQTRCFKT